jgi:hypothetical protein
VGLIDWPDYDKEELFRYNKVINELDFLPLYFLRILAQTAKLLRTHRGKLVATPLGRRIFKADQHGPLPALLFHVAFWHLNLGYFDRYPIDSWPLTQMGIILWSLHASAHDWLPRETLTRLCAAPVIGVLESQWDFGSGAMEARILRPLMGSARREANSPGTIIDGIGRVSGAVVGCVRVRCRARSIARGSGAPNDASLVPRPER